MHAYGFRESRGVRWFCHFLTRSKIGVEFYWGSSRCGFSFGPDDEGWNVSIAFPPFALYLSFEGLGLWRPRRWHAAEWTTGTYLDGVPGFWLVDRREFDVSVSEWTLRLTVWGRWGEWHARDPWWIRGVSLNLVDLVLGRSRCTTEDVALDVPARVPMPEGTYRASAKVTRYTWRRARWFTRERVSVSLDIPGGIPYAGKGENAWDCGDDGLWGCGGDTVAAAVLEAQRSVADKRQRYGRASDDAMREAAARVVSA